MKRTAVLVGTLLLAVAAATGWYFRSGATRLTPARLPLAAPTGRLPSVPRTIVVVVEENKSYEQIFGDPRRAPYLAMLARRSAVFTNAHGVAHPSQPNYFALFAGRTNDNGDTCPATGIPPAAANLGAELIAAHHAFRAYAEDLPAPGFGGCASGLYARKHAPWTHFVNVPRQDAVPFSTLHAYETLPDVGFIIPNLIDDMHSGSIEQGDAWLHDHIAPLVAWADRHNGLIIVTWDESSSPLGNHIPTLFAGPMVAPGRYGETITHERVLRTIEDLVHLPTHAGLAADESAIADVWRLPSRASTGVTPASRRARTAS